MLDEETLKARLLASRPETPIIIAPYKLIVFSSFQRLAELRSQAGFHAPVSRAPVSHQRVWTADTSPSDTSIGPIINCGVPLVISTSLTTPVLATSAVTALPSAAAEVTVSL